jgi:hypothetical protein
MHWLAREMQFTLIVKREMQFMFTVNCERYPLTPTLLVDKRGYSMPRLDQGNRQIDWL